MYINIFLSLLHLVIEPTPAVCVDTVTISIYNQTRFKMIKSESDVRLYRINSMLMFENAPWCESSIYSTLQIENTSPSGAQEKCKKRHSIITLRCFSPLLQSLLRSHFHPSSFTAVDLLSPLVFPHAFLDSDRCSRAVTSLDRLKVWAHDF